MIRIFAVIALMWAPSLWADVPERVEAAFRSWADDVGATSATLTLWKNGVRQHDVARGDTDAQTPIELASLSKAITAVCAVTLINDGHWNSDTTSRAVLGIGPEGLTLGALLTHSGGVMPDQTQSVMGFWLNTKENHADLATFRALARTPQTGVAGQYAYNNENYAILGEMIAAQMDRSYQDVCTERVLRPAGVVNAAPSERTHGFLPWGGWKMSVSDYAAFLNWAYGPKGVVGSAASTLPAQPVSTHVSYGMGMFQRPWGPSYNFWHFGALCFPMRFNRGSYAVRWQNGWSVVAAYDVCVDDAQMIALDGAMVRALFP